MIITKAPKGTEDLLPQDSYRWQYLEEKFKNVCDNFGYKEIRVPTFEHTELFERGVGDTTDVVEKQMYTFLDKGDRSITLRPEGTASVVRCFLERNLYAETLPLKMWYNLPCFRYENKQKGRLREFHQFGVEAFGAKGPSVDAEVIALAITFLENVGLSDLSVNINSIGCPTCRNKYNQILKDYLRGKIDELCDTCKERLKTNPLRILDCKSPICGALCDNAPKTVEHLCPECDEHFTELKCSLEAMGISYDVNPRIVRGLDYYTRTVFEFISDDIGAQSTVCGGGRYDGLVKELDGPDLCGIGFGLGITRLVLAMKKNAQDKGISLPENEKPLIYIAPMGKDAEIRAIGLVHKLRSAGVAAECDITGRSLKAQMKYADKIGARYAAVIGDNELAEGKCELKDLRLGEKKTVALDELASIKE